MAGILSTANNINMALKESGIVIDMSPAANGQLSSLANSHSLRIRHTDESIPDVPTTPNNSSAPSSMITFRCERCDDFETNSRASLLLHVVQCLSNPSRSKTEEPDPENLSVNAGSAMDQTSADDGVAKMSSESHSSGDASSNIVAVSANSSTNNSSTSSSSRKVFECDVCNMKFSNGANMRRHKMRHTGVKPYECRVCQKRFFRKDHLAEHFTTHTKTLPYHCPICNRGFQRQIAMRAHFQNEHVGQHDLVKTCPLCSYRAGSMKSLRIHFFNRHGIDLDNPGPGGTSSLLLALETQATQVAAAAVAANFVPNLNPVATQGVNVNNNINLPSNQSDSNESLRSAENGTPPMHFLTPHVEISTLSDSGNDMFNGNTSTGASRRESLESKFKDQDTIIKSPPPHLPDHPECNAKSLPSSTSSACVPINTPTKPHHSDNHITPSISLIPIKQEPSEEQPSEPTKGGEKLSRSEQMSGDDINESDYSATNNKLTSLIKVSPLKSLLREDLKRRICAKANSRINRNATILENNNAIHKPLTPISSPCNSIPICNGTITSTGQETESLLNRKQILTCLFCGIEFPDETLYFLHKGCHCDSNPWKCNICGEQCNNVYEFNSHLLSKSHQ